MFSHHIISLCVSRVSFKCQCVYGLYSFAWTEQVRPLHASYLKTGSLAEVRPLQASLVISLCAWLGWSILVRSCLWVSIWAPKGSVCLWFLQFWRGRTSETTAHTLLKSVSQDKVRPLQAPLIIPLCALLEWSFLILLYLWVSIWAPKGSMCLWFVQFCLGRTCETTAHTLHEIWVTGWSETTTNTPYHITLCFVGSDLFSLDYICGYQYELLKGQLSMVCTVLPEQNNWNHCTHLTWKLGHWRKWDHYKHPLLYHRVLCWGDLLSLDHLRGYQYELLKGQFVYGLCSFGGAEQVRPLHTPYLKSGSEDEMRPLQAPLIIPFCALLGVIFFH